MRQTGFRCDLLGGGTRPGHTQGAAGLGADQAVHCVAGAAAACIAGASHSEQRVVRATLSDLLAAVEAAGLTTQPG
jgi:hypothetical protein